MWFFFNMRGIEIFFRIFGPNALRLSAGHINVQLALGSADRMPERRINPHFHCVLIRRLLESLSGIPDTLRARRPPWGELSRGRGVSVAIADFVRIWST